MVSCSDGGAPITLSPLPLPAVVDRGGPKMPHPQLVQIRYSDDPNGDTYTAFAAWIVQSEWLRQVGPDYGVGMGSVLGNVELPDAAPDFLGDLDVVKIIFDGIEAGTLPSPPAGDFLNTLYIVNLPAHSAVLGSGQMSCRDYLGFHASARRGDREIVYAVIPTCADDAISGLTSLQVHEVATSHEIIEAATDPVPANNPGFQIADRGSSWVALGDEVADLCERGDTSRIWLEEQFYAQRVWSKTLALVGEPCLPQPGPTTYFNVLASPDGVQHVQPGGSIRYRLSGYATSTTSSRSLIADSTGAAKPTLTLGAKSLSPGFTTTIDVGVPADAIPTTSINVFVFSTGGGDYQVLPLRIVVGPVCSAAHDCVTCTQNDGCGWCSSSNRCENDRGDGSADSSCAGSDFAQTSGACPGFCGGFNTTCEDCSSAFGCGWCQTATGMQCLEFGGNGSSPKNATCEYADWSFTPEYCAAEQK